MYIECQVDTGKGDGSTRPQKLPMFDPHQIVRHLVKAGLKVNKELIKQYWDHLQKLDNPWAKQVNDKSLIPSLICI